MPDFIDAPEFPTYYLWVNATMVILLPIPAAQNDVSSSAGMVLLRLKFALVLDFLYLFRRAGRD